jgi:transcriptional regulator with XRE-family HTH domain
MRVYQTAFAQTVRQLLDERKMRPLHLARKAGVSSGYISELLSGKKGSDPTLYIVQKIARGFDMSTTAFISQMEDIARAENNEC